MERLQKFMAECGVASRRKCEELIINGQVKVNGVKVDELGTKIKPKEDVVELNGKILRPSQSTAYIMLNKPVGYITSAKDQFNRPTVLDLVSKTIEERVYPVGRLDYDSCGLLLLTNDGDLTFKITHPKHSVTKEYLCLLDKTPDEKSLQQFSLGVDIGGYITNPAEVTLVEARGTKGLVLVKISEGKNRQVRKMWQGLGYNVLSLQRIAVGEIRLGDLEAGKWRYLSDEEIKYLKKIE